MENKTNLFAKLNCLENEILKEAVIEDDKKIIGFRDNKNDFPEDPIIALDKNWNAFALIQKKYKNIQITHDYEKHTDKKETNYYFQIIRSLDEDERKVFSKFYKEIYAGYLI